jgi:hypothetical protein
MQDRYWMFQRKGVFYVQDKLSGKQKSLKTRDAVAAKRMLVGKNQATEQPQMNLAMAKVYLSCKSDEMLARTWDDVMKEMEQAYSGPTLARWRTQIKSVPFQGLRKLPLLHTESSHFLAVLRHPRAGTSAQKWLRILHNRALDLGWILAPVMARRIWPKLKTKRAKAISAHKILDPFESVLREKAAARTAAEEVKQPASSSAKEPDTNRKRQTMSQKMSRQGWDYYSSSLRAKHGIRHS